MQRNIDKEVLREFIKINVLADKPNTKYKTGLLLIILLNCAWGCKSLHSLAELPNSDTIFHRIHPNLETIDNPLWKTSKRLLKRDKHTWQRQRVFLTIDETYESYTGKKQKLSEWIFGYRKKRGETGNFKYLVFALVSNKKKLVIRCIPIKKGENIILQITQICSEIHELIKFKAILMDRGFYNSELVSLLQASNLPFIIRAKLSKSMRSLFDFATKPTKYDFEFQGVMTSLVTKRKKSKIGFLTNLPVSETNFVPFYYRSRWNIENIFLACDKIHLKTNSTDHLIKYLFVVFSLLIYNLRTNATKVVSICKFCVQLINALLITCKSLINKSKLKLTIPGFMLQS
jgi:hypothetical protein